MARDIDANGSSEDEQTPTEYAVDALGDINEALSEVEQERLPPSVSERFGKGSKMLLDALGEAEALQNAGKVVTEDCNDGN